MMVWKLYQQMYSLHVLQRMPKRPCAHPGCNELIDISKRYCEKHTPKENRPSAYQRGYDGRWQRARKRFLAANPFCVECRKRNLFVLATDVDHIIPHKGSKILFWSEDNWQPLCHACHSRKTQSEDNGGWY